MSFSLWTLDNFFYIYLLQMDNGTRKQNNGKKKRGEDVKEINSKINIFAYQQTPPQKEKKKRKEKKIIQYP